MTLWYADPANVAALIRWLDAQGRIDVDGAADLVEKPWKYSPEWGERRDAESAVTA